MAQVSLSFSISVHKSPSVLHPSHHVNQTFISLAERTGNSWTKGIITFRICVNSRPSTVHSYNLLSSMESCLSQISDSL